MALKGLVGVRTMTMIMIEKEKPQKLFVRSSFLGVGLCYFSSFSYLQGPEVDCGFQQGGVVFLQGIGASSCFSIVIRFLLRCMFYA